ncbi:MAG: hypothetical protein JWM74_2149, partial [Myxococcaceae bacterium]|nr:hypothetical protein [Myxococcaceae bacterium]
TGTTWTQEARLTPSVSAPTDYFGTATALSNDTFLVSTAERNAMTGTVFLFTRQLPEGDACTGAAQCHSGFCVDGVCCNVACGNGAADDCQACNGAAAGTQAGTCGPAPTTVLCRASRPACDVDEHCDGLATTCPADITQPNGTACASGTCLSGACTPIASTPDAGAPDAGAPIDSGSGESGGCNVAGDTTRTSASPWLLLLAGLGLARARRSSRRSVKVAA